MLRALAVALGCLLASGAAAQDCAAQMDLTAAPDAVLELHYLEPCAPGARIVVSHEGLTFTGKLDEAGEFTTRLPALSAEAEVAVRSQTGAVAYQRARAEQADQVERFAVQWLGDADLDLNAFEFGASRGGPGHVSTSRLSAAGHLDLLGDESVSNPLRALIYTAPTSGEGSIRLVLEAAVTEATCGRDVLGETLRKPAGAAVMAADLTVSVPDCGVAGQSVMIDGLTSDIVLIAR